MVRTSIVSLLAACHCITSVLATNTEYAADLPYDFPNTSTPQPFHISVDPSFIHETQRRAKSFRSSRSLSQEWTNEGPPQPLMKGLASYWGKEYDWFEVQRQINGNFSHYATTVPGSGNYPYPVPLHFVHERSSNPNAIPLLILHGWPSSHLEYSAVIKSLASDPNTPFHVVVPDLPGFGFSPAPLHPGLDSRAISAVVDSLMHQIGYERYGLITTDLGWFIGSWMVNDQKQSLLGHFTDFFIVPTNETDIARYKAGQTTPEETAYITGGNAWFANHSSYANVHAQKPLALSQALNDSPVGFAGWIWDLSHQLSDTEYSFHEIITNTLMLYIPGAYNNIRSYLEIYSSVGQALSLSNVDRTDHE